MFSSMPVTRFSAGTCRAVPMDATVSHSAAVAPPCRIPYGCTFPTTGIRATTRSANSSTYSIPSFSGSPPRMFSLTIRTTSSGGTRDRGDPDAACAMVAEAYPKRDDWLDAGPGQDELGGEPHDEPGRDAVQRRFPRELAPRVEQLAHHVHDRSRGERQEGDRRIVRRDRGPQQGAHERRPPTDQTGGD